MRIMELQGNSKMFLIIKIRLIVNSFKSKTIAISMREIIDLFFLKS